MMPTEDLYGPLLNVIEFLGTFAFAISGIRHAAAKRFDWFGGFVCGVAVAIGGGTLRDLLLGVTPFWMTSSVYLVCTFMAQVFVIVFARSLKRLDNTWFFLIRLDWRCSRWLVCRRPSTAATHSGWLSLWVR